MNKEAKVQMDKIYNLNKRIKTKNEFDEFVNRVNLSKVKNDGSDPVLSVIDKYILDDKNSAFKKTINKGRKLYRARIIKEDEIDIISIDNNNCTTGFDETNSREVPLGVGGGGRNNIEGVSYLYLANSVETACSEVKPIVRQLISVAEFEVAKTLHIIDFSTDKEIESSEEISVGRLFTYIMTMYFKPVNNYKEYKASQVLTDYLRKSGIDGICYRSHYDKNGINYTIFNSYHKNINYIGSRVLVLQSERRTYLDFNNKEVINACSMGGALYENEAANEMIEDIKKTSQKMRREKKEKDKKNK